MSTHTQYIIAGTKYTVPQGSVLLDTYTYISSYELQLVTQHQIQAGTPLHELNDEVLHYVTNAALIRTISTFELHDKFIHQISFSAWEEPSTEILTIKATYIYGDHKTEKIISTR